MADSEALCEAAPVKWVAVEGGIVTLYQLGRAGIVSLIT